MTAECSIQDCGNAATRPNGWCHKHYYRYRTNGDPLVVRKAVPFSVNLKGDAETYRAIHKRLRKSRGPASRYLCIGCGNQAKHWAYKLGSPKECVDGRTGYRFSPDFADYSPMCISCHWKLDDKIKNMGDKQWRGGSKPRAVRT